MVYGVWCDGAMVRCGQRTFLNYLVPKRKANARQHLLPEHVHEDPWKVSMCVSECECECVWSCVWWCVVGGICDIDIG